MPNPNINKDGTAYIPYYKNQLKAYEAHINKLREEGRLPKIKKKDK